MRTRTVIRDAIVITVDDKLGNYWRADVLIEGSRIAAVAPDLEVGEARQIDAAGKLLIPGFVDAHRFSEPV